MNNITSHILGKYKFTYQCGTVQILDLISHEDFEKIIKPAKDKIYMLEFTNKWKPTGQSKEIKKELKLMFGENYFTDCSPLFEAYKTGFLTLPKCQGGIKPCNVVKL